MPTDNDTDLGQLYLLTKDGRQVPMAATALCIPDLISLDMNEKDTETDGIAFRLLDSYTASFTVDLTNESAKRIRRFWRRMKRYARRQLQQYKRKLAKEKRYGL